MEYKGLEYILIQTIAPSGWRWHLTYLGHEFSDIHPTRHEAVRGAQRAIDNLMKLQLKAYN